MMKAAFEYTISTSGILWLASCKSLLNGVQQAKHVLAYISYTINLT